ncbi:MAG: hypothetical protein V4498_01225 [candidate division FCPU426 bacterium]
MRRLAALSAMVLLLLMQAACEKKNPNTEPPPPFSDKPVGHHRFDGGESDPYSGKGNGGDSGAEAAPEK